MRCFVCLLAGLWAIVQVERADTDFDYAAYAGRRFERAMSRRRDAGL